MGVLVEFADSILPETNLKHALRMMYLWQRYMINPFTGDFRVRVSEDKGSAILTYEGSQNSVKPQIYFPMQMIREGFNSARELLGYIPEKRLEDYDVIIDVGAYPGDFSALAAGMNQQARVIALEPDPKNREVTEEIINLNELEDRIEVLPYALLDQDGQTTMTMHDYISHVVHPSELDSVTGPTTTVETVTLDTLLGRLGLFDNEEKRVLIKMDIEGDEVAVIKNAPRTLARGVDFAIAAYHIIDGQQTSETLEQFFAENGYISETKYPTHLTLHAEPVS